jgi:ubiquinone/menaquinone biosynthesis C-methylase UbiE
VAEAAQILTHGQVMGVDMSATMLKDASARNADLIKAGRVGLRLGGESPLPFPDVSFNKVMAVNSFQFWAKPEDGLGQVKRVLKTGGRAAITVQPMWVKSDDEARQVGDGLKQQMLAAGFKEVALEVLPLKPLCFCAAGLK